MARKERKRPIAGIVCLCQDPQGNIIGDLYKSDRSNLRDLRYIDDIRGEHWGCMLTEVARRYPFPEVKGFIPEGYVWLEIAKDYDDACINEPLRIYHSGEPDNLSRSRFRLTEGNILYARAMVRRDWRYVWASPMRLLRAGLVTLLSPLLLILARR